MQQPLHFTTQNAPLAEALAAVGFKLLAVWNRYTDDKLKSIKCATVEDAKKAGRPGHLTYVFEQEDDLAPACAAYDAAGVALDKGEPITPGRERVIDIIIARAVMRGHFPFRDLWKSVPAEYIQGDDSEVKIAGTAATGRSVTMPGFRVVSDGLSEADRTKIFPQ